MAGDFHLAAYSESIDALTDTDLAAPVDGILQLRNSHLIMSEPYNLIAAYAVGADFTRANFTDPKLTTHGLPNIWPIDVSATVTANPPIMDVRDFPIPMPIDEELTINVTSPTAGANQINILLWLASPNWSRVVPRGSPRFMARATATTTGGGAGLWSDAVALTMQRDLLGGVYAVIGAWAFLANALAFRFQFPRQRLYGGRQLRPGGIAQNAIGNAPRVGFQEALGEWGRFHTFELPSVQTFGAAGATEVRLDVVYLGQDMSMLGPMS